MSIEDNLCPELDRAKPEARGRDPPTPEGRGGEQHPARGHPHQPQEEAPGAHQQLSPYRAFNKKNCYLK